MPTKKAAKKAVKTVSKAAKARGCTPFFVEVIVLPNLDREITFGLSKACNPVVWTIDFILKEKMGKALRTRVKIHVRIGPDKIAKAEKLAETKTLSPAKVNLLEGRVADRAAELPPGTSTDEELERELIRVL